MDKISIYDFLSHENHCIKTETVNEVQSNNIKNEYNVLDLARAFLSIEAMTHKKLQKLCFYAKAWYLAINDENLIADHFEAWVHGAVQPTLYHEYRAYGFNYIPKYLGDMNIPEVFINFAKEVYETYGKYDGDTLEKINHSEDPWKKARLGLKPWESCENEILEEDIKNYYRSLMK